jgi:hypothetical protein
MWLGDGGQRLELRNFFFLGASGILSIASQPWTTLYILPVETSINNSTQNIYSIQTPGPSNTSLDSKTRKCNPYKPEADKMQTTKQVCHANKTQYPPKRQTMLAGNQTEIPRKCETGGKKTHTETWVEINHPHRRRDLP